MSMITATTWVPRGFAASFPTKYEVDEAELSRISKLAKLQLNDAKEDLDTARDGKKVETSADDSSGAEDTGPSIQQSNGFVIHSILFSDLALTMRLVMPMTI